MITKMKKLTFLVYHREYEAFLKTLRDAGVVHIQELERGNLDNPELQDKLILASKIKEALKRLERLGLERSTHPTKSKGKDVLENLEKYEKQLLDLKQELVSHDKLIETLEPWGDFNPKSVERLLEAGLVMNFFICSESNFESDWVEQYNAVKISKDGSRLHFVTLTPPQTEFDINAEHIKLPPYALHTVKDAYKETKEKIEQLEAAIAQIAREDIDSLDLYLKEVQSSIEFSKVVLNTQSSVEDKLMVLQGWIPAAKQDEVTSNLAGTEAYYEISDPQPDDDIPILLENKGIFAWFEPIVKLYMLPKYNELDLTPFFAPFFMVFFGLCLGDSGYGLFLFLAATLYKLFAKNISKTLKPILSLVQILGISTVFCGLLTGGFFGAKLYSIDHPVVHWLESLLALDMNKMFVLSLVLGVIQVLFGMVLKAVNETIQLGFKYAIATIGWFVLLLNIIVTYLVSGAEGFQSTLFYVISGISALGIVFYNSPDKNIFVNIGLSLWDTYNMATGLLGDILSYVRLFALGLSGGILAEVFNSLATGMSPDNAILGPIVMVLIFVIGHAINIFMNVLGAMVHPMRLTFVEFFKNAGYEGGGQEYSPFKNIE